MEFAEGLTELMDAAARGEAGPELLSRCCGPGLRARRVKRGERILHAGFPIRSVRIMLSGRCHVLTISRDGRSFIAYVNEGFQIYGLTELLCGGEAFSASITAEEDCLFAEADARRFCTLLENGGGFSGVVLRYLASLVERRAGEGDGSRRAPADLRTHLSYTGAPENRAPLLYGRMGISREAGLRGGPS